jgi:NMD protein affecting ribosome stability and mRNA decay
MGSRKTAINGFCRDCIVDVNPRNGTALSQITNCTSYNCKLYPFRPTTRVRSNIERKLILAGENREKSTADEQFEVTTSGGETA